jgi:hypothetical protein
MEKERAANSFSGDQQFDDWNLHVSKSDLQYSIYAMDANSVLMWDAQCFIARKYNFTLLKNVCSDPNSTFLKTGDIRNLTWKDGRMLCSKAFPVTQPRTQRQCVGATLNWVTQVEVDIFGWWKSLVCWNKKRCTLHRGMILFQLPKYLLCKRFSPEGVFIISDKFQVFWISYEIWHISLKLSFVW